LDFNQRYAIGANFRITCIKDGFYDSGLFIEAGVTKILNLNDCEVRTRARACEIKKITGNIDVLLTQFSYAAWKGGVNNTAWRTEAAEEKLATVRLQVEEFEPKYCIPFASFIYFSNSENYYLNDSSNTLQDVSELLVGMKCNLVALKPLETFSTSGQHIKSRSAIEFWDQYFRKQKKQNNFQSLSYSELESLFDTYIRRITSGNNIVLMKLLSYISPVSIFQDVVIHLHDLKVTVKISLTHQKLVVTNEQAHLGMHSFMLGFIFKNTFDFDTLTVNGCFEELCHGGFVRATKSLAIENLNNLGFYLKFSNLFNYKIIFLFLNRLYRVSRKLE
jgi:UDP-MurNAc hydroxylase